VVEIHKADFAVLPGMHVVLNVFKRIQPFYWVFVCYFLLFSNTYADVANHQFKYPFYLGVTGGYGWTTWQGLVPEGKKKNFAMAMSTPKNVTENGGLWGLFAGYEFLPSFALEVVYLRYPNAKIEFDLDSIFSFEHDDLTIFTTRTETIGLMGKIMMTIPCSDIRVYSSFGYSEVHRSDAVKDNWVGSPSFGAGLNYNFTPHIMGELGGIYTAGKGESELSPAEDYFPFMYAVFLRLAYRF